MRRLLVLGCLALACARAEGPAGRASETATAGPSAPPRPTATAPAARPSSPAVAGAEDGGSSQTTTLEERAYFPAGDLFQKKLPARPGDWLAHHPERAQSFLAYQSARPIRPTAERNKLVIQPLGAFGPKDRQRLEQVRRYLSIFFDLPVAVKSAVPLPKKGRRTRTDEGRTWVQHFTRVLLDETLPPLVPNDAIVLIGVTMEDLYPDPQWNYVFGQATLEERVGVHSLARFYPKFWGEAETQEAERRGLERSAHILAHETGHAFTMHHCTEYECLMNGANSLDELDRQAGELCPVCLRKLGWNVGFDVERRTERLRDFHRSAGMDRMARWSERRLEQLRTGVVPPP